MMFLDTRIHQIHAGYYIPFKAWDNYDSDDMWGTRGEMEHCTGFCWLRSPYPIPIDPPPTEPSPKDLEMEQWRRETVAAAVKRIREQNLLRDMLYPKKGLDKFRLGQ